MGQPTKVSAKPMLKYWQPDDSGFDLDPDSELDSKTETPRKKYNDNEENVMSNQKKSGRMFRKMTLDMLLIELTFLSIKILI